MTKKILAVLLALAMIFSMFTVNVFAADEVEYELATSFKPTETITLTGWKGISDYQTNVGFPRPDVRTALSEEGAILKIVATGDINYFCIQDGSWANKKFGAKQVEAEDVAVGEWDEATHTATFSNDIVKQMLAIPTWNSLVLSGSGTLEGVYVYTPKKAGYPDVFRETEVFTVKSLDDSSVTPWNGGWGGTAVVTDSNAQISALRTAFGTYAKNDNAYVRITVKDGGKVTGLGLYLVGHWSDHLQFDTVAITEGNSYYFKMTDFIAEMLDQASDLNYKSDWLNGQIQQLLVAGPTGGVVTDVSIVTRELVPVGPKPEKTPKSYELNKALDVEPVTENGVVTITPNGTVKTQSLYLVLDEPAATAGTVTIYYDDPVIPYTSEGLKTIDDFGASGWGGATFDKATKTITYVSNWTGIGLWFDGMADLANYDSLKFTFPNGAEIPAQVVTQYPGGVNVTADLAKGATEIEIPLKDAANITQIYIQCKEVGTLTLGDVLMRPVAGSANAGAGDTSNIRSVSQKFEPGTWEIYMAVPNAYRYLPINKITITLEDTSKTVKISKGEVLVMSTAKTGKTFAYAIQLSDTMHGYLVNGRMLPMPHTFVNDVCSGCGFKKKVSIAVETEKEDDKEEAKEETKKETSNKPYYTMTKTTGQNFENNISSKTGVELEISDGMTRLATDWVNKDAWDQLFKAMKDHKDGNIVLTYTGTITEIGVEHDNGGAKERDKVEITDVAEVNGKNVYTIAVADFLPVIEEALEDESWKNFYVIPDEKDGAVLYGFQIARPAADDAEEDAEEEVKLPDPYVFPLEADTELTEWKTLLNYENEDWGSDTFWTPMWGDSKIEIEYTGDGEPELIAQYAGAKGYFAAISPESVKDTKDGTRLATFSVEKLKEALVRDANKKGFKQDDESDPYGFFAISIDGTIWGEDGQVVENLVYKSGRVIPSKDPAKDPEYTDFYTIKPGTELSEWTPLVWWEGNDDITEIFNWLIWLDGAKIEINYTGDALLLIAQYGDGNGNDGYSSVPEPDEIIENEDGSKTAVYDCANYIKAVRADAEQYNFDPYETVEWVYDNGHVYGYTLDGRFWDEEGNQTNSIFNWAKISAPAANN